MAISQSTLSAKLKAEIIAEFGTPYSTTRLERWCNAVAKAIVDEIHTLAKVQPGTFQAGGDPVTGEGTIL